MLLESLINNQYSCEHEKESLLYHKAANMLEFWSNKIRLVARDREELEKTDEDKKEG
jgi:hypothetical protein